MTISGPWLCVYWVVAFLLSGFQGFRGFRIQLFMTNQDNLNPEDKDKPRKLAWSNLDKIVVRCFQGAFFSFVCSMAGFVSLFVALKLWGSVQAYDAIGSGTAILIATSFLVGMVGIGGELAPLILQGKFPWTK